MLWSDVVGGVVPGLRGLVTAKERRCGLIVGVMTHLVGVVEVGGKGMEGGRAGVREPESKSNMFCSVGRYGGRQGG